MINTLEIKNYLKSTLSEFRYEHSLMVAEEAKKLALHYNQNSEKAYLAGLVHDIAKEFTDEENQKWIQKYHISTTWLSENLKPVLHAEIGSVVVKDLYNLDEEICNSVKYHALGNYPMTTFEKIIYVADKIARKNPDESLKHLQLLAYKDLDQTLLKCLQYSKSKLESKGSHLEPITETLLTSLLQNKPTP